MRKLCFPGLPLILLAIGLVLAACTNPAAAEPEADDPLVMTGTNNGKTVTIRISQTVPAKAVLTPKSGDRYEIRVDGTLISWGTLSVSGATWTFTPASGSPGDKTPFTGSYSSGARSISIASIPGTGISNLSAALGGTTPPGTDGNGNTPGNNNGNNSGNNNSGNDNNNGGDDNDDDPGNLSGTVTIDDTTPEVGDVLTASYSGGNGSGTATWQWLRGDTPIEDEVSFVYIVASADVGKTLKARVSFADQSGSVTSAATTAVPEDERTNLSGTVEIDNKTPKVDDILTVAYTGPASPSGISWKWYVDDTPVYGLYGKPESFQVINDAAGKTIRVEATHRDYQGSVSSAATAAVKPSWVLSTIIENSENSAFQGYGSLVFNGSIFYWASGPADKILKITNGEITPLAGSEDFGEYIAVDNAGNLYAEGPNKIVQIDSEGNISEFADLSSSELRYFNSSGIAVDGAGNTVYLTDIDHHRVLKVSRSGTLSVLAGSGSAGYADGQGESAQFNWPEGIAVDNEGNVFVGEAVNNRIRKIEPDGTVSTVAGNGEEGYDNGPALQATFMAPIDLAFDSAGNLYVNDNNVQVRKISFSPQPKVSSLGLDNGLHSFSFNASNDEAMTADKDGNLYLKDGNKIIKATYIP